MGPRAPEWIVVAYFFYLPAGPAVIPNLDRQKRRRVIGMAVAIVIVVLALAAIGMRATLWRDWMPIPYILIGYWLPALLVRRTNQDFEGRLLAPDRPPGVTAISERAPRSLIELLELAYLCCYPMVPIGFACLNLAG